jgi:membrane protease YdiL (CAAX protease family)
MTTARWEIALVILTGLGNFLLADWLGRQLTYVVGAFLFWTGFVVVRAVADFSVIAQWGFSSRNFGRSVTLLLPVMVLTVSGFAAYGMLTGRMLMHWHFVLICLLYPLWGLVQQFLIVALLAGNMKKHSQIPDWGIVFLTALIFAAAHLPYLPLVAAAAFLAVITTSVYLRTRNLWALGIFHGWYGASLYFFVLGQDLWKEVLSTRLWP